MTTAVWQRFGAELRSRRRAWLGLGLLVGPAAGAVLALAAGARRTDSAYRRFLEASNAYDVLVINYAEDGTALFDFAEIERLPQVADAAPAKAATVASQATAVVVVGLVIGMPVGIALGRWTWTMMADTLGVLPRPQVPLMALVAIAGSAVVVADVIAFLPRQLAVRTRPAAILRSE